MAKGKLNHKASEPGLIRVLCPDPECGDIHRLPVNLDFTAVVNEEGGVDIEVHPDVDMSAMVDHMAFEHGWI